MDGKANLVLDTRQSAIVALKRSNTFAVGDIPKDHLAIPTSANLKM